MALPKHFGYDAGSSTTFTNSLTMTRHLRYYSRIVKITPHPIKALRLHLKLNPLIIPPSADETCTTVVVMIDTWVVQILSEARMARVTLPNFPERHGVLRSWLSSKKN